MRQVEINLYSANTMTPKFEYAPGSATLGDRHCVNFNGDCTMFMIVRKNSGEYFIECFESFVKYPLVEYYQIKNFAYGVDEYDFVWLIHYTEDNASVKRLSYDQSAEFLRVISVTPHSKKFNFGAAVLRMIKMHLIAEVL